MSKEIKVIDSRMGKGKTSYLIKYMQENYDKRFIFVTPYLKEVTRIEKQCEFISPKTRKEGGVFKTKLDHFKDLVEQGISIVTTHQLFKMLDLESLELLKEWDYILVLDEVLDVISVSKFTKNEFNALHKLNLIKRENNTWVKGDDEELLDEYSYDWKYADIVRNLARNSVEIFEDKILIWLFPVDVLECFEVTYILTYMFDGYPLRPYLELYNFNIIKYGIENYDIVDYYEDDTSDIKKLVSISEGKVNDVGEGHSAFTIYWYENIVKGDSDMIFSIRKGLEGFYKNKMTLDEGDVRKDTILWTTFSDYRDSVFTKSFTEDTFIAHNTRATNDYDDKYNIAYLANRNYNPDIKKWFVHKGLNTNDDSFALSEMIQWLWRSRIRKNLPVNIYVPSERMRNLLKNWLGIK